MPRGLSATRTQLVTANFTKFTCALTLLARTLLSAQFFPRDDVLQLSNSLNFNSFSTTYHISDRINISSRLIVLFVSCIVNNSGYLASFLLVVGNKLHEIFSKWANHVPLGELVTKLLLN